MTLPAWDARSPPGPSGTQGQAQMMPTGFTVYNMQWTVYSIQYTVDSSRQYAVYSVQYSIQYTVLVDLRALRLIAVRVCIRILVHIVLYSIVQYSIV